MRIETQRQVDRFAGSFLCRLLSLWPGARRRHEDVVEPQRILVILLSEMGSLVLTRPLFEHLKAAHPKAEVWALVFERNQEALELLGLLPRERIVSIRDRSFLALAKDSWSALKRLRALRLDVAIDCELFARISAIFAFLSKAKVRVGFERHTMEGLYRGDFMNRRVLYNPYQHIARQFVTLGTAITGRGTPVVKRAVEPGAPVLPPLDLPAAEVDGLRARLERDFPEAAGGRLVLLYPSGGALPIRAWPEAYYAAVAAALRDQGFRVGLIGLPHDKPQAQALLQRIGPRGCLDLTGWTKDVRELVVLFRLAHLLITNDGGPGHFATLAGLPAIVLYGPETPALYGTANPKAVHLFQGLSCSPCLTAYNHRRSPCDGDNQCLKTILPEQVLREAHRLLA
jgi:ADP-heptose:LPS heptosyltransferase